MRAASYQDLRVRAFSHLGQSVASLTDTDELRFRNGLGRNFRHAWTYGNWPFSVEFRKETFTDGNLTVAYPGDVLGVYEGDPQTGGELRLPYALSDTAAGVKIIFPENRRSVTSAWVKYKRWEPSFDWGDYDGTADYSDWDCAWKENKLQRVEDSVWSVVPIPYIFKEYLAYMIAADLLTDGGDSRKGAWQGQAEDELFREFCHVENTQGQGERMEITP